MTEKDRKIIQAIRSMGLFRTNFTDAEVSAVVAKALRSFTVVDELITEVEGNEEIFPSDRRYIVEFIKDYLENNR